jgi:CheY-like chemotaxis protein
LAEVQNEAVNRQDGTILLVEDNEDDVFFMRDTMKRAGFMNPLQVVTDGRRAVDYLSGSGIYGDRKLFPMPCVVFLDLKLPKMNGYEVLAWIRAKDELRHLPVGILSGSNLVIDIVLARDKGATFYLAKPPTKDALEGLEKIVGTCWLRAKAG